LNSIKNLAGQTAIYGLSSIIGRLLNYLLVPLYTIFLFSPEEYGVVTELYAYVGFLIILFTYGLETAFFRFSESESDPQKVYGTALGSIIITSTVFVGIILLLKDDLADLLSYSDHKEYIIWFGWIVGLDGISSIPFARLRQLNQASKFAIIKLINIGANLGFNLFFLVGCPYLLASTSFSWTHSFINTIYDPGVGVGYIFIANLIASSLTLLLLLPVIIGQRIVIDLKLWNRMIIYALPLLLVGFAGSINEMLDRALLKHFLPFTHDENMAQIGIYGACYKLSIMMILFIQAFRFAAEPFFFAQYSNNNDQRVYAVIMKYFVITTCLIFLGIMLYLDIFKYFIGKDYHEGLRVVPILLLANLFLGIYYNLSIWYKFKDKTMIGALIAVGGALITIVLNIMWIPVLGYMGSALATLICYGVMVIASYIFSQKHFPVKYDLKRIIFYLSLAVLFCIISLKGVSTIAETGSILKFGLNTVLFLLYLVTIFFSEKSSKQLTN